MEKENMIRLNPSSLRNFYFNVFQEIGLNPTDSNTCADGIIYADLNGIDSHGLRNLDRIYLKKIETGDISTKGCPTVVTDFQAISNVDGRKLIGFVTADFAIHLAQSKASTFGIGMVTVFNSSHCGSMGYYTSKVAKEGFLSIACTNLGSQAILPPPGGLRKLFGTNVIAISAPTQHHPPFTLDMSAAAVSTGRVRLAAEKNEQIPQGWLVTENNLSTTDPSLFDLGKAFIQFLGGSSAYKGYGLAIAIDILAGILSGANVGSNEYNLNNTSDKISNEDANIGHCFIVINIKKFMDLSQYYNRIDQMFSVILRCPSVPGKKVAYPGSWEDATLKERTQNGIPILESLYEKIKIVSKKYKIIEPDVF